MFYTFDCVRLKLRSISYPETAGSFQIYHFSAQFSNPLESHKEISYYSRRSQQREDWEAFMRRQGFITISGIRVHTCWDVGRGVVYGNLVPRVLWLFGQQVGASRDAGEFEKKFFFGLVAPQRLPLFYRRNLALTEFQYPIPQSLYWRPPADQKARGPWVRDWVYGGMWCV